MDIQPATNQPTKPISDDQELAKVLAGVPKDANPELSFDDDAEEPSMPSLPPMPAAPSMPPMPVMPNPGPVYSQAQTDNNNNTDKPTNYVNETPMSTPPLPTANNDLDSIRKDALLELRPLVDKLDLAPEEKFDIYLLLLRSTDDTALIAPAHEAAKNIADEAKRAEALLDIIKEIDFLAVPPTSNPLKPII